MHTNRSVRFDFGGSTVLLASREDQVSFNTTVDVYDGSVFAKGRNKLIF